MNNPSSPKKYRFVGLTILLLAVAPFTVSGTSAEIGNNNHISIVSTDLAPR